MELAKTGHPEFCAPIRARAPNSAVPLTPIQRRLWAYLKRHGLPLSLRMCVSADRVLGTLNVEALQRSIEALLHRHEALRTRLIAMNGVPWQHIDASAAYRLNIIDLSSQSTPNVEFQVKSLVQEFFDQKIDLSIGPSFEARLWKLSDREHVLVLLIDHFVSDGVSNSILAREMWTLYDQAAEGRPFSLPSLPVQFADYAVWLQESHDAWMQKHESYWREHLKGVRPLVIPSDAGLTENSSTPSLIVRIPFGGALSSRLRDTAQRERTLLPLLVLTAYAIAMSRWCGQEDLLIPFVSHGRQERPELENVIGYFSQDLHLRIDMDRTLTLHDLLAEVQREFSRATEHQDFNRVPDLVPECKSELTFHWQSGRQAQNARHPHRARSGQVRILPFATLGKDLGRKFVSYFYDTPWGIGITVNYRPDCLTASTISRFGEHLRQVATALVDRPYEQVGVNL